LNWTKILEQVSKIRIKSITDSLFRYGLYLFLLATISAVFKTETWVTITLFSVAMLFELVGLGFYCYFAKKNPDYLRSESFQIKKQSIEILGDKDNQYNANVKDIVSISSPFAPKEIGDRNNDTNKFGG
jgi:hypothetical protein